MKGVILSPLLEMLISKAKLRFKKEKGLAVTAERLIISAIEYIEGKPSIVDEEIKKLSYLIENTIPSYEKAKERLTEYVMGRDDSLPDILYYYERSESAVPTKKSFGENLVLDSVRLFAYFFQKPSVPISEIIKEDLDDIFCYCLSETDFSELLEKEKTIIEKTTFDCDDLRDPPYSFERDRLEELVDNIRKARNELLKVVFGQDNAVNAFINGYYQAEMNVLLGKERKGPLAFFLLAGPPGTGKTFMAEEVGRILGKKMKRFDMSEMSDSYALEEFCGSKPTYKSAAGGSVTGFVSENPKCVLLFDELEKAHSSILNLFLQILDSGFVTDKYTGQDVSFRDTIIIFTTNAGKQLYESTDDVSNVSPKVILNAIATDTNPATNNRYFSQALCSRFASGNVIMFNQLKAHNIRKLAKKKMDKVSSEYEKKFGMNIRIDEGVYTALLYSEGGNADARTVSGKAESFLNSELYELFRLISSEKSTTRIGKVDEIHLCVDLENAVQDVSEFFDSFSSPGVLVFADKKIFSLCKKKVKSMNFHRAEKLDDAVEILKKHKIDLIMLDVNCGVNKDAIPSLNVEDVDSSAREFLKFIRERRSELPVYLMETEENIIGDEERVSFSRQGCRGVITLDKKGKFAEELDLIAYVMHQQGGMEKLAKANKAIFFETAQRVCEDGKVAEIRLFDFSLATITSAEDSKKFTSSISMPDISFESVIGAEEAKRELLYFVDYLKNPNKFLGTGVKAPRGVIFYGPPGTGKTMLAKAMAKEAGVPFIAAEGNQFLKTYLGDGPESVHKLFRVARKYAPSIIFIDEIDAIGKARTGGSSSSSGVEATLTAFLAEMDGFSNDSSKPVFILAATNFDVEPGSPKSLDSALMRRFDRRILIDLPNKAERIRYLKMRVAKNPALEISEGQIENIATRATGTSLASLESVIELALRSAIREKSYKVTDALFEEAFETFTLGEIKHWDESQLERTARHEAGHTLLCWLGGETPSYLTIVPRGNYGGYMQRAEREGKAIYTREEILGRIRISLGGRATEIVYYGEDDGCSTGASGDLAKATELARRYVCEYGMDESFGIAVVGENSSVGGPVSVLVREAVNRILNEQMEQTVKIVSENKEKIDALVSKLLEKNHMNGSEIEKLLGEE